jgi:hypothetical protein
MSIIVLTCDTKKEKCPNRIRWERSVNKQKLKYSILGENKLWQGWKWRIKQYLDGLIKLENEKKYTYAMITDCWDVIIQRRPNKKEYKILDNTVILGAEKQKTGIFSFSEKYKDNKWHNINGGFYIGKISNLIILYKEVLHKWDACKIHKKVNDQHVLSYVFMYSKFAFNIQLDVKKRFVLNFTKNVNKQEYIYKHKSIYSKTNKNIYKPIALHNPGNPKKPIHNLNNLFNLIVS